jgi:hypothetical protein
MASAIHPSLPVALMLLGGCAVAVEAASSSQVLWAPTTPPLCRVAWVVPECKGDQDGR